VKKKIRRKEEGKKKERMEEGKMKDGNQLDQRQPPVQFPLEIRMHRKYRLLHLPVRITGKQCCKE
jgi:hypothetical protein